jgi:tRNA-dihydrouridine synthase B
VLQIGPYRFDTRVVLAPMVGVTDAPYRAVCARAGTRLAIAEMISAERRLWNTRLSRLRRVDCATLPRWVQIVGNDPRAMAGAARAQADLGAEIVDINMGCPAKNVCGKGAGSALLRDEPLVGAILAAVVAAVPEIPVTLKIRTGWSPAHRNGVRIARIAEDSGIRALSVHGRTRACRFEGEAEYDTIRDVVRSVRIPVIANGDIGCAAQARHVLEHTGADAVMIGRAAQGAPWLCGAIDTALRHGGSEQAPCVARVAALLLEHVGALHAFYGEQQGLRIARKHVAWYVRERAGGREFLRGFHALDGAAAQLQALRGHFNAKDEQGVMAA